MGRRGEEARLVGEATACLVGLQSVCVCIYMGNIVSRIEKLVVAVAKPLGNFTLPAPAPQRSPVLTDLKSNLVEREVRSVVERNRHVSQRVA